MGIEIIIVTAIVLYIFEVNNRINSNKFVSDNKQYFNFLKEDDYEFLLKLQYGGNVDVEQRFMKRLKSALIITLLIVFICITNKKFLFILLGVGAGYLVYKSDYRKLKRNYKAHLHEVNQLLPYYLKSLEILIHHYTVPVAMGKSIEDAPDVFKPGLQKLVDKINAGDSTINPYMDFAIEYPVRDSMRMMRLLYRLGLGAQENKHQQLLTFSKTISNLQNKSREQKYKDRLGKMEKKTMTMLICTGGGSMLLMALSIVMLMGL